ncbi:SH3 domain-binding glutamic acid-rich protein homolog isoform X2 [Melanaphis sacchari]|uniref:SH3 domain-binding glutamic acid-rich protein homolog isoform X2 n=1 Tax=Melanaphis sacchari TaxID=742174 RepID=UPI000DC14E1C|nr:SH3 domain-binding glutamic acid-rich protein homolog isoform X2 [Melanaphis sacchari]
MVVKVYMSGISGNKEVKKRQQRVTMILDSKSISYDLIDITEPGKEDEKAYMQNNSKTKDGSKNALPPQIFNDDVYCGENVKNESTNEVNDSNDGTVKENVNEEQQEPLTSDDEDSDNESLDTQNKLKETTGPNSVPLPDETNVLLDIPETKKDLLSETEEEIEE